jgi:DNA-binding NtrC family response regulator
MSLDPAKIAVCATPGARGDVEELAKLVRDCGDWEAVVVRWPDPGALPATRGMVACYILLAGSDGISEDLRSELALRPDDVPLIAIGGLAEERDGSSCWLPSIPCSAVLGALLKQLVRVVISAPPPPSITWRRKTDMIIGNSSAVRQLLATLDQLAGSTAPVIITGESGTGKELVARALHYTGMRAREPFIAINCAAIPENLFESELFGHQRGAFTGAVSTHEGAFEAANKGTLFLDEIGEMPRMMQPKMLRVLETGEVTRLGSNEPRKLSVRVVAATNRKLETEVKAGRFREDLYYRLRVYPVHILPLRERPEDIPPLVTHYLALIAARERRPVPRLTAQALEALLSHRWPGNVRELVNILERAFLLAEDHAIDARHIVLPTHSTAPPPLIKAYRDAKSDFESAYYSQVMRTAGGNVSLAAKLAGKTRKEVYDALKRLGLDAVAYRSGAEAAED